MRTKVLDIDNDDDLLTLKLVSYVIGLTIGSIIVAPFEIIRKIRGR